MKQANNLNKKIIIGIMIATLVFITLITSYAYFTSNSTVNPENIGTASGTLSLIFSDGNSGFNGSLEFGESYTKTFTIENNGTLDATAVMHFENLINTYTLGSLTYTLIYSETENGEYKELVSNKNIPTSSEMTTKILSNEQIIPAKQKYYYQLKITLNYLDDVDQTDDLNAIFITNFKITEEENIALETLRAMGLKAKQETPDFSQAALTDEKINNKQTKIHNKCCEFLIYNFLLKVN